MKNKFYYLMYFIAIAWFSLSVFSCSKDDDNGSKGSSGKEEPTPVVYSPVGVWENGKNFVSFSSDNFCSAYFDDSYIDCGTYIYSDKTISCENSYYAKKTTYTINKISNESMELKIDYVSVTGKSESKTMTFTKNTSKSPAVKDHSLVGKSYSSVVEFGGVNTQTWSFETYNTGTRSMKSGSASKYPLKLFYIFIDGKIYFQSFKTTEQMPSIGGWNPTTTVQIFSVSFGNDGSLKGLAKVD